MKVMLPSAPSAVSLAVTIVALTPAVEVPVPPLAIGRIPDTLVVRLAKVVEVVPVPPLAIGKVPVTFVAKLTKVVDVVPVPPLAIGNVPLTCVVRLTPLSVPPRVRLPAVVTVPVSVMPLTVPVPPTLVTVPAPRLARAAAAEVAPVPPLAITNVPASTTAPVVGLLGVNPVVPALKLVTPLDATVIVPAPLVTVMPVPAVRVLSE